MSADRQGIRILVVEQHAMFREALRNLLDQQPGLCVIGEAADGREAVEQVNKLHPDILLLDLITSYLPGMEALRRVAGNSHRVRTIVLADTSEKHHVVEALKLGARGVVPKQTTAQLLVKGIRAVAAGEYWVGHDSMCDVIEYLQTPPAAESEAAKTNGRHLTVREVDVVNSIVDGYTNKDIALKFQISEQTVKHHLTNIFEKVGVSNRLELALHAMHQDL
ncbi:MAG: response regulator transcription factor [Acidobacteriia bacterium]|nr:response regulator transcription factor [Terriglobia bacterium]